ncbi:HotDog domain-containing protein [Lipomyces tetrasporus]|uniref:HotDog domain-containing protein n=1 Tax=Lipomyces tetrasporus TaxID=54092 RepID=A0AAD7QKL8_9ASCO|nr:HotDog domain-containing protein [Lipomyces tetrasporus]KAJ8097002.1 HotDog domain-containing protein [Lipomyces tetrasporus]
MVLKSAAMRCASALVSARTRNFTTSTIARFAKTEATQFIPQVNRSPASPMRRTITWLEALHAREEGRPASITAYAKGGDLNKPPEIFERTMDDSYTAINLPFKQDQWLLDAYVNSGGRLRIGQIFQDLDALAGVIAYKHCAPAEPTIVTASVDRISLLKRLTVLEDVELSGNVTWTGRSSMEITIKARTVPDNDVFLTANFTFVARHPITGKSFPINTLVCRNDAERQIFERAESYNAAKKRAAKSGGLLTSPPNAEEAEIIHAMWLRQRAYEDPNSGLELPAGVVHMKDSMMQSTMLMQPQYRNRHSYMIFGGYLLRQTFELAYCCAAAFSHGQPHFISLDQTTFRSPVPVGSVLYLTATVAYTQHQPKSATGSPAGTFVQVRVDSTVRDIDHGTAEDSGSFTYTYFVENKKVSVLPVSYTEAMGYLEGRRNAIESRSFGDELRGLEVLDNAVTE